MPRVRKDADDAGDPGAPAHGARRTGPRTARRKAAPKGRPRSRRSKPGAGSSAQVEEGRLAPTRVEPVGGKIGAALAGRSLAEAEEAARGPDREPELGPEPEPTAAPAGAKLLLVATAVRSMTARLLCAMHKVELDPKEQRELSTFSPAVRDLLEDLAPEAEPHLLSAAARLPQLGAVLFVGVYFADVLQLQATLRARSPKAAEKRKPKMPAPGWPGWAEEVNERGAAFKRSGAAGETAIGPTL